MTMAGSVLPSFKRGVCRITNTKLKAFSKGVMANTMLMTKNTDRDTPAGIRAAKDFSTVGGTPSGILMTHPFLSTQE